MIQRLLDRLNKFAAYTGTWVLTLLGGAILLILAFDLSYRNANTPDAPLLEPFPIISIFWLCVSVALIFAPAWIGGRIERTNAERDTRRAEIEAERKRLEKEAYWKAIDEKRNRENKAAQIRAAAINAEREKRWAEEAKREAAEREAAEAEAKRKAEAKRQAEAARLAALPPRTAAPRPTQVKQLDGEL